MDIEILRECYMLSQNLSFTKTAKDLFLTQSVLSRHIASLETEVDAEIFVRTKNGLQVSKVGESFLRDIKRVVDDYDSAIANLRASQKGFQSKITVAYLYGACLPFLPKVIAEFKAKHPNVKVNAIARETDGIFHALDENEATIGLTSGLYDYDESTYCTMSLARDGLRVYFAPGHPLEARESISLEELKSRADVVAGHASLDNVDTLRLSGLLDSGSRRAGEWSVAPDILSFHVYACCEGVGVLGYSHIEKSLASQSLLSIPVTPSPEAINIKAVWKRANGNDAVKAFAQMAAKEASKVYGSPADR